MTLKVTSERLENCIVALHIEVDDQETHTYLRQAARKLSQDYRIAGFRPGKAPYDVVVQRFGLDAIREQVVEQFGEQIFEKGLEASGIKPAERASLEQVTWDPFTLHVKVPVEPMVNLGNYRDIRIEWQEPVITDQDVEGELNRLRQQHAEWQEEPERGAELGDQVVLDITGKAEGKVVLGNKDREMVLNADSPYPIPGFAQQVVGMKVGESREFDLTYPADHYNPDTAGKEAHFEVTLHRIRVEKLPELNDEFAALVGDYENLEDLKNKLRQSLLERTQYETQETYLDQIWERLRQEAVVEYPQIYVDRELEVMKRQIKSQLQQNNIDLENYLKLINSTEAEWKEGLRPQAVERLVRRLILQQVIEQEKIQVKEEEIEAETQHALELVGDDASQLREWLQSSVGQLSIIEDLLTRKATERLIEIARGQAPDLEQTPEQAEAEPAAVEGTDTETQSVES